MRFKAKTAIHFKSPTTQGTSLTNSSTFDWNSGSWSLSGWIYIPTGATNGYFFIGENSSSGQTRMFFSKNSSVGYYFRIYGVDGSSLSSGTLLDQWAHIIITYDSSSTTAKTYINNSLQDTLTGLNPSAAGIPNGIGIGGRAYNSASTQSGHMWSQFTWHQGHVLTSGQRAILYGQIGYNDLTEQQKTDLNTTAWYDFVNDYSSSNFGKNLEGTSAYDLTLVQSDPSSGGVELKQGNFLKGISKTKGDRISQITSSDSSGLLLTADTSDLNYVPRYKATPAIFNSKPAINFNQSTLASTESYVVTSTEQYLSANIDTLSGKEMTIFVVLREATNSGGGDRTILASKGSTDADSKDLWLYVTPSNVPAYVYGNGSEQKAAGVIGIQYHNAYIVTYELNESDPKIHVNAAVNTNSLTFSKQAFTALSIGARVYGSTVADKRNGDLAELIIYNKKLSSAQINTIKNYLNGKYQIY